MELLGLGTDIIEIERIDQSIKRHKTRFLDKLFTSEEQNYCLRYGDDHPRHFAARFAAKEAVVKALGTGFSKNISWQDIEIKNDKRGKPQVFLSEKLAALSGNCKFMISLSHCRDYALASVVAYNIEKG
ncbi:MAG: holo-ACP synthase [Chlamydiota bacterium]